MDHQEEPITFASDRPVYEWNPDYTEETAPPNEELENELFSRADRMNIGISFSKYDRIAPRFKNMPDDHKPINNFGDAKLHPAILENIERMSLNAPTPIQKHAIPLILNGHDLMACAQTGSGKTLAFLAPVLSKLLEYLSDVAEEPRNKPGARITQVRPQVLIILPTRELAIQIFDEARRLAYKTRIRPVVIYGGSDVRAQKAQLFRGANVLIATPGRLLDSIERGHLSLENVKCAIVDEADRMLEREFAEKLNQIFEGSGLNVSGDPNFQTIMFSATFPESMQILGKQILRSEHCSLRIGRIGGTTTDIVQNVFWVEQEAKDEEVHKLLMSTPPARTIIFVDTKIKADHLDEYLYNLEFPCISIHGDRTQSERESSLEAFRTGRSPILVATAVAARGLDIKDVVHVINYDLCDTIDEYVHRIGRTARAGNLGLASSFYNNRNISLAPQLTQLLVECDQGVPDFLKEFIEDSQSFEQTDFVDLDQLNINDSGPMYGDGGYVDHRNDDGGHRAHYNDNNDRHNDNNDRHNDNYGRHNDNNNRFNDNNDHFNGNNDRFNNSNDRFDDRNDHNNDVAGYRVHSYDIKERYNDNSGYGERNTDNQNRYNDNSGYSNHYNDGQDRYNDNSGYRDNHHENYSAQNNQRNNRDFRDNQYDNGYRDDQRGNRGYNDNRGYNTGYRDRQPDGGSYSQGQQYGYRDGKD